MMQVMLDAFVENYAGASMCANSSVASILSQRPASVGRKRKENQLHRELSAATLTSHKIVLGILHEYRLKARNSLQFKTYKTIHVALCFMYCKSKEMASKVVNNLSLVEVCETQIEDALLRRRMLRRSRCMSLSVLMLRRFMVRRFKE